MWTGFRLTPVELGCAGYRGTRGNLAETAVAAPSASDRAGEGCAGSERTGFCLGGVEVGCGLVVTGCARLWCGEIDLSGVFGA